MTSRFTFASGFWLPLRRDCRPMAHGNAKVLCGGMLLAIIILAGCGAGTGSQGHGGVSVDAFSPPSMSALVPSGAPVNSSPFTITVKGKNFGTDAIVFWNGTALFTRFVDSNDLYASLTSTNLMLPGMIQVYVRTAGMNSNTLDFDLH